jgi:dTDP-4-dehydrorhamnose 3,5-epimerase
MGREVRHRHPGSAGILMRFVETTLPGLYRIEVEPRSDERGVFARTFCEKEFAAHHLPTGFVQCNTSFNTRKGTLRGLHFQTKPFEEGKLVRCTQGAILDVIVDLRKDSPAYCRWQAFELTAANRLALFVPPGLAHGFLTLTDGAEVFYQMTEFYSPEHSSGVRWDDPAFGIRWPVPDPILSDKDRAYPPFSP